MNHKRIILYGGLVYLSFYFWLSVHFFIQRSSFVDGPWMLVNLINHKTFYIPLHRFSLAVTEWLPLIGIKLGMSFQSIAVLYSISYPVLFLILFMLCIFWLRDFWAAMVLILVTCIGVKFTFYVLPLEGIIGVVVGVVALSWSRKNIQKLSYIDFIVAFLFSFLIVFAHPLNSVAVLLCLVFLFLDSKKSGVGRILILSLWIVVIFCVKIFFLPANPYESDIVSGVYANIGNFFSLQSHTIFFERLLYDYYWLPIIVAGVTVLLMSSKKYLQVMWYIISILCFVALVNLRNYDNSFQFYIEHSFLSLPLIILFPIVTVTENTKIRSNTVTVILSVLFIMVMERCAAIYSTHNYFDNRIQWQTSLIEEVMQSKSRRVVVCTQNIQDKTELVPGKLPYETLFLSKIYLNKDITISTAWNSNEVKRGDSLVIYETELRIDKLNPEYFQFPKRAAEFICR